MPKEEKVVAWCDKYLGGIAALIVAALIVWGFVWAVTLESPEPSPCIVTCGEQGMGYYRTLHNGFCVCDPTKVVVQPPSTSP